MSWKQAHCDLRMMRNISCLSRKSVRCSDTNLLMVPNLPRKRNSKNWHCSQHRSRRYVRSWKQAHCGPRMTRNRSRLSPKSVRDSDTNLLLVPNFRRERNSRKCQCLHHSAKHYVMSWQQAHCDQRMMRNTSPLCPNSAICSNKNLSLVPNVRRRKNKKSQCSPLIVKLCGMSWPQPQIVLKMRSTRSHPSNSRRMRRNRRWQLSQTNLRHCATSWQLERNVLRRRNNTNLQCSLLRLKLCVSS
mmetsp:Transcript_32116/g.86000  ORF Transcript_32116/g.86000 Transcript_32116/m.86000 type:complete len:244 (+) Transcript_32116:3179-3910(+)